MIELYLKGFLLGLGLTSMIGPIFFTLVENSLEQGWKSGLWAGIGMWVSDFLFILFCILAIVPISQMMTGETERALQTGAGIFFLAFGIILYKKRKSPVGEEDIDTQKEVLMAWLKGFTVNTLNPFTFLFWTGSTLALLTGVDGWKTSLPFYFGVMTSVIAGDLAKVFLAARIRRKVNESGLEKLRKISGIGFLLFGLWLLFRFLF